MSNNIFSVRHNYGEWIQLFTTLVHLFFKYYNFEKWIFRVNSWANFKTNFGVVFGNIKKRMVKLIIEENYIFFMCAKNIFRTNGWEIYGVLYFFVWSLCERHVSSSVTRRRPPLSFFRIKFQIFTMMMMMMTLRTCSMK